MSFATFKAVAETAQTTKNRAEMGKRRAGRTVVMTADRNRAIRLNIARFAIFELSFAFSN